MAMNTPEQIAREAAERLVPLVGQDNTWDEIYGKIRLNIEQSILNAAHLIVAQMMRESKVAESLGEASVKRATAYSALSKLVENPKYK